MFDTCLIHVQDWTITLGLEMGERQVSVFLAAVFHSTHSLLLESIEMTLE